MCAPTYVELAIFKFVLFSLCWLFSYVRYVTDKFVEGDALPHPLINWISTAILNWEIREGLEDVCFSTNDVERGIQMSNFSQTFPD